MSKGKIYKTAKDRLVAELLHKAYRVSKKKAYKGLQCTLTYDELYSLMEKWNWSCCKTFEPFPILDKEYKRWQLVQMGINPLLMPSIDRVDSNGHYTIDNIQIVIQYHNLGKTDNDDKWADEVIQKIISNSIK